MSPGVFVASLCHEWLQPPRRLDSPEKSQLSSDPGQTFKIPKNRRFGGPKKINKPVERSNFVVS